MLKQVLIVKCEQRGLTVIELMIALSILLIVLALGFNFYFYGVQAFGTGEQRTIVQNNVRLAAVVITEELRFADQVEIYDEIPPHQEGKRTIYLNEEDGQVIIRDEEGNEQPASGQFSSEVVFTDLSFSVSTELNRILFFSIAAEREGEQNYQLESEVAPLNQKLGIVDKTNGLPGIAVIYTVMNIGNIPRLSILPILIAPGEDLEQLFELSLTNDKFVNLINTDIILSGEAFSDLTINDIEIMSFSDATAGIKITGDFKEGLGSVTVLAAALEGNYDLTADVAVLPDYLFIVDDFIEDGIVGIAYTYTLTVTGGTEPYTFFLAENEDGDATVLPSGLLLDTNTGTISGIPLAAVTDHEVFIGVSDAENDKHVREYSITIGNRQYNLSIASVGSGTTFPESPGNYLYDDGTLVIIEAIPKPGAEFTLWDGDVAEPGAAVTTVIITGDMTVIANFTRVLVPLNEIEGGYYLKDIGGNIYIKLTGNSYMVLHHQAGNVTGKYGDFAATKMPSKSDLEGGVWVNETRKEPGNKPYWTNTRSGTGANNFYTVNASGILEAKDRNEGGIYLREITTFPGYLVEKKAGTLADPHILIDPGTL